MSRLNPLSLVKSFAIGPLGFRLELRGGHVVEYRQEEAAGEPPRLEPPTFDTVAEPVEPCAPGLAKTRPALRLVGRTEAA